MRGLLTSVFAVAISGQGFAAEIKSIAGKDGRSLITIAGEINPGDTEVFKSAIKAANDAGKFVANVRLNSMGGNLVEGVKLADAVRFGKISTNVGKGAICASACFLVFAAGTTKFASYGAQIGVHGASDRKGEEAGDGTVAMARVAKDLGVPPAIIGRMVVTPPSEMVWLTPQDLQSMGTTLIGKPDQIASADQQQTQPVQTAPGQPVQIAPQAKASAPPSFEDLARVAFARSAEQNGGTANTIRGCEAKYQVCWSVIMFKDKDGLENTVKVTRDSNEKIVRREFCWFNASKDIRKCLDWDKSVTVKAMKDISGDWVKIGEE